MFHIQCFTESRSLTEKAYRDYFQQENNLIFFLFACVGLHFMQGVICQLTKRVGQIILNSENELPASRFSTYLNKYYYILFAYIFPETQLSRIE